MAPVDVPEAYEIATSDDVHNGEPLLKESNQVTDEM